MEILKNLAKYIEHKTSYVPDINIWLYGEGGEDEHGNPRNEFELVIKNENMHMMLQILADDLTLTITKDNAYMLSEVIKEKLGLIGDPDKLMADMLKQVEDSFDDIKAIVDTYSSDESKDAYHKLAEIKREALTINFEVKRTEEKIQFFNTVEELIAAYRKLKDSLFAGLVPYNHDFKLYKVALTELDISQIDSLM